MNYYNEFDPYAAEWLRNLIAAGCLPAGDVDERSIVDVAPSDLAGYTQCHFFAGIGGWPLAARIAGWPDDQELWTGSPPCQPFSVAGKGKAQADDRHLWPHMFRLARSRRPAVLMGEQVAAAVGKNWLDGVFADLEGIGYACGAAVVPACAVDAPHRRDRLWFVAERDGAMDHSKRPRLEGLAGDGNDPAGRPQQDRPVAETGICGTVGDHNGDGCTSRGTAASPAGQGCPAGATAWGDFRWVECHDGKARRVQPGLQPLGNGFPARVGRLRAYGNAIVPQVAAEVIGAFMDAIALQPGAEVAEARVVA